MGSESGSDLTGRLGWVLVLRHVLTSICPAYKRCTPRGPVQLKSLYIAVTLGYYYTILTNC